MSWRFLPFALPLAAGILGCGDGSAPASHTADPARTGRPRNVLIVVLDTLRPDRLPFYGSERPTAPRLEALARESFVFENAQSSAPITVAELLSLMTSLYPEVHGVQGTDPPGRMSEKVTTLAEILKEHGYATAAFTEGAYAFPGFGLGQGFDVYPPHPPDGDPSIPPGVAQSRLAGNLDRTIDWLRNQRRDPFFLFFHTYEVHSPYWTKEEYVRMFRPQFDERADHARVAGVIERWNRDRSAEPEDCLAVLEHLYQCPLLGLPDLEDPDGLAARAHSFGYGPEDAVACEPLLSLVHDLYDASIRYADHELERLWDELDELQLTGNTLVVVVSDHGEGLGQHHEMQHSNVLFEEALHVLMMFRVPDPHLVPRHVPDLVRSVDVVPTVLELLGIEDEGLSLQGRSLGPLLRGEPDTERVAFSHARRVNPGQPPQYTLREGPWRMIYEPATDRRWLYDHRTDPGELTDVAAENPEVVARLDQLLARQAEEDRRLRERIGAEATPAVLDLATQRELRAFGYTGSGADPAPGAR